MSLRVRAIGLVVVIASLAVGGYVLAFGSWPFGPTIGNTPAEMFEGVLVKPIPEGVSDLQGTGDMWQSYTVWLRFQATEAAIDTILADGFVRALRADAEPRFRLSKGYDRFSPGWSPPVGQQEYYRANRCCAWSTSGGRQWLLIDRSAGLVYVFAEGD